MDMLTYSNFAYLVLGVVLFGFWFLLFLLRKDLRKEMLLMSLLCTPFAITELFFVQDYWYPDTLFGWVLGIENFIFCFCIGGIATVVYELFMRRKLYKHKGDAGWGRRFLFCLTIGLILTFLFWYVLPINFMYASFLAMSLGLICMLSFRRDLLKESILSGLFFCAIYFLVFQFCFGVLFPDLVEKWWFHRNLSGARVLGQPIEESLWAFYFGALCGPAYRFVTSSRLRKFKSKE